MSAQSIQSYEPSERCENTINQKNPTEHKKSIRAYTDFPLNNYVSLIETC